ncbi:MAG: molybdopterin cofactor-binding domain-containing protein [Burkholderiaceae bacterium]
MSAASRLPGSLYNNRRLSQWLRLAGQGIVEVRAGKVELGQGIVTALAQIVADELDVAVERISMVPASTPSSPNEEVTSGSLSVQECGLALRQVCAEARALFTEAAAAALGVAPQTLTVRDGTFSAPDGRSIDYWAFAAQGLLERDATGRVAPKDATRHVLIGRSLPRSDLPDKVFGVPRFVHDLEMPGMCHGRVLRPPSPAATLVALDEEPAQALAGVTAVVRDGSFVGVVATREEVALRALERLRAGASWHEVQSLPEAAGLVQWLKHGPAETHVVADKASTVATHPARTMRSEFFRPFTAHASLGPSAAVARWNGMELDVWSHTQGIYNLRTDLAMALRMPAERIRVQHVEGAGCYGHNGADDVALDAALLARSVPGRPVKVVWSREDELAWAPFGAAMAIEVEADLDGAGDPLAWRHEIWSNGHGCRPGRAATPGLLAASHLADPFERLIAVNPPMPAGGAERNAVPAYDFPASRVVCHRLLDMPIRTSALRSLGAFANVFAIESFVDEIAHAKGEDPVEFRLRHLPDPRARAVIEAATRRAHWRGWRPSETRGHGVAYAKYKNLGAYCAVVAEVEAGREIRVTRLVVAVDVGLVINPDGVVNQIEGGAIQASSWTLKEAVAFDRTRITSTTWEHYPILKFSEVPAVEVEIVSSAGSPSVGAGEAAQGPTAAAIGNAVFAALGLRVRELPITPERIIALAL